MIAQDLPWFLDRHAADVGLRCHPVGRPMSLCREFSVARWSK